VDQSQAAVIRYYYEGLEQLNKIAGELDIWEIHLLPGIKPGSGYGVAAVIPTQFIHLTLWDLYHHFGRYPHTWHR
jgi:hypothetical protein